MFVVFFVLALVIRLAIALQSGMFHRLTRTEMEAIALNVAGYGGYDLYGGPTAYSTPVFPLYLAALAGGISVLYIGALDTEISGGVDGPWVAIALLILVWAILRMWRDGSWQARTPWWFFAFCGFCALLNPSLLPIMGGFLLAGAVACPAGARRRYLRQTALVALGIVAFLLPWAIRNYWNVGTPIMTRSNFGIEFWVSNGGPDRTFDHPHNYDTYHPSSSPAEAAK